ncbi:MAG TPA: RiPP maturation radical SAM C-methyltransferase [Herpetosiphonaceae bacterium]
MLTEQPPVERSPEGAAVQQREVVLVSMPFGPLMQPSIGLGLLKASLRPLNVATEVLYFSMRFARCIGAKNYDRIANEAASFDLVGEWIFSGALFEAEQLDTEGYIEDVMRRRSPGHQEAREWKPIPESLIENVLEVRSNVDSFLDDCVQEVLKRQPRIVGLTSIFQQQIPSLALARRLKAAAPELFIVMGGANCEGIMGVEAARQFPFVDAIVSGEGDLVFPQIVERVLAGGSVDDLRGVYTRRNVDLLGINGTYPNAASVKNMDDVPIPDYDDFFVQLAAYDLGDYRTPRLMFETSRGCWWGEKNHCTFCGLNGSNMTFRSKSAKRALDELIYLTSTYPGYPISVVDNILDYKYFKDFVPELAARELDLELFYEVKANLRKEQVRLLRDAGITLIQPGIESLSSDVLEIMHKGVKALQNIQLLKWCKELGIKAYWNVLWGFPREQPESYAQQAELVPLLTHLAPPGASATIRLDRFSPNFDAAEQMGFTNVEPYPAYRYMYPLPPQVVANLAYYFTFEYRQPQEVLTYTRPLADQIIAWRNQHATSDLFSVDKGSSLLIWDLRPIARQPLTVLRDLQQLLYVACDSARNLNQLRQIVQEHTGAPIATAEVEELLRPLLEQGLMLREDQSYLSLAIPLGDYSPRRSVLERFQEVLQTLGRSSGDHIVISTTDPVAEEVMPTA